MEEILNKIDVLIDFMKRMEGLNNDLKNNPYAQGVDINRIVKDTIDYLSNLKEDIKNTFNAPEENIKEIESENPTVEE